MTKIYQDPCKSSYYAKPCPPPPFGRVNDKILIQGLNLFICFQIFLSLEVPAFLQTAIIIFIFLFLASSPFLFSALFKEYG